MPNNNILRTIEFCKMNKFSFFPLQPRSKQPYIKWQEFQKRHPTDEEVMVWIEKYPDMNLGIVTWKISQLVVVDLDSYKWAIDSSVLELPKTFSVKTGGWGEHHYYTCHFEEMIKNSTGIFEHVDIRGDWWYIVGPESIHENWNMYQIIDDNGGKISEYPKWIISAQQNEKQKKSSATKDFKWRNDKSTHWIWWILKKYPESEWEDAWQEMIEFNLANNNPPLDNAELRTIYESICKSESKKRDGKTDTQINRCMRLLEENWRFIRDQIGDAYFVCRVGGSQRLLQVEGASFREWVQNHYHKEFKSVVSPNLLKSIESLGKCRAEESDEVQQVDIRIQKAWDAILYDLLDPSLSCVWIDSEWWRICEDNPGYFKRWKNSFPQVCPVGWGDISKMWNYINISDPKIRTLILTTIITRFIPDIQHPILMIHGPKWSAKSTFLEVLKALIDPSSKGLLSLPWESNALIHTFLSDYLLCYDNISKITNDTSDDLCRAVSGSSLSKRKLHTDSDDIIYKFKKAICINGINLEANQPDLLQRSVIIQLEAITNRITPSSFWAWFNDDLPGILWAIFTVLSDAISIRDNMDDTHYEYERLADFHKWGEAICQALWNAPWHFSELLKENTGTHDEVAISSNLTTSTLMELMKNRKSWEWTATELRGELHNIAAWMGEARYLPATAHTLMNTLNRYKENLLSVWISITSLKSWTRKVVIQNTGTIDTSDPFK